MSKSPRPVPGASSTLRNRRLDTRAGVSIPRLSWTLLNSDVRPEHGRDPWTKRLRRACRHHSPRLREAPTAPRLRSCGPCVHDSGWGAPRQSRAPVDFLWRLRRIVAPTHTEDRSPSGADELRVELARWYHPAASWVKRKKEKERKLWPLGKEESQ
jgi:hypothetical protein